MEATPLPTPIDETRQHGQRFILENKFIDTIKFCLLAWLHCLSIPPPQHTCLILDLLASNHVIRERPVDFDPGILGFFSERFVAQLQLDRVDQGPTHGRKVFRFDAIRDVLLTQVKENLCQELNVWAQHAQGLVDHLDKVFCVLGEAGRLGQLVLHVGVPVKAKDGLRLGFQNKKSGEVRAEKTGKEEY